MGESYVLRGGTVVDGRGGDPTVADVLIRERRIAAIGSDIAQADGTDEIDVSGKYVVPGLMDMHIHISVPVSADDPGADETPVSDFTSGLSAMYALNNARNLIAKGVTTIRDAGSHGHSIFALQHLIDTGQAIGPRIYASGRPLAMTGGHALLMAAEADGPDEVRRLARQELKAGARALKLMASGSGVAAKENPLHVELTQEELAAAVHEAKARGRTTLTHAHNPQSAKNAVLAGTDSIEHGSLLDEETLRLMRDHGVALVPTVWIGHQTAEFASHLNTPVRTPEEIEAKYERQRGLLGMAKDIGVKVAAGTDSCLPVNPPDALAWELAWYVEYGFTPMEALQTATLNAAQLLGLDDDLGTLEPGKLADVVVVAADPLETPINLSYTTLVFKEGDLLFNAGQFAFPTMLLDTRGVPEGPIPERATGNLPVGV